MNDSKKIIKDLNIAKQILIYPPQILSREMCIRIGQAISAAIAFLKEPEAVEPLFSMQMRHFVCGNCSLVLDEGRDDYCPSCGKRIAWTEYYIHEDDSSYT